MKVPKLAGEHESLPGRDADTSCHLRLQAMPNSRSFPLRTEGQGQGPLEGEKERVETTKAKSSQVGSSAPCCIRCCVGVTKGYFLLGESTRWTGGSSHVRRPTANGAREVLVKQIPGARETSSQRWKP